MCYYNTSFIFKSIDTATSFSFSETFHTFFVIKNLQSHRTEHGKPHHNYRLRLIAIVRSQRTKRSLGRESREFSIRIKSGTAAGSRQAGRISVRPPPRGGNEDRCQITWVATCLRQDCRLRFPAVAAFEAFDKSIVSAWSAVLSRFTPTSHSQQDVKRLCARVGELKRMESNY